MLDAMITWTRTCQECGHYQKDTEPREQGVYTKAYDFRKCKKCGSEALDYGSNVYTGEDLDKQIKFMEGYE